jgi:hypothetical protein
MLLPAMLLCAFALVPAVARAAEDEAEARKRKLAMDFMNITGVAAQGAQLTWGLLSSVAASYPDVPEEVWTELHGALTQELVERSLPIYTRNFDELELSQLIAFYESEIGRKLLERTPAIFEESASVLRGWDEAKIVELGKKLKAKGYEARPDSPTLP